MGEVSLKIQIQAVEGRRDNATFPMKAGILGWIFKVAGSGYDEICIHPVGSLPFRFLLLQAIVLLMDFFFFSFSFYTSPESVFATI